MLALGARGREFDSLKSPSRGYGACSIPNIRTVCFIFAFVAQ